MEFLTINGKSDGHSYIATYRKWFSETLGVWELELVPGTLRWLDLYETSVAVRPQATEQLDIVR
jgi:hypothetical protein